MKEINPRASRFLTPEQRARQARNLDRNMRYSSRTPLIERVWFKMLVTLLAAIALAFIFFYACGKGNAETGSYPHLDNLCYNPAFTAPTPNPVGIRAHNDYCSGSDVILPPNYGSGHDRPEPPVLP